MINKITDTNRKAMKRAIKFLPVELTQHSNFGNYFLKYWAYTFDLNAKICDSLHTTLVKGFKNFRKEDI